MNFKTKAVVLRCRSCSEDRKYLSLLTLDSGILNVLFKIRGSITKSVYCNVYVAGFYEFNLFRGRFGIIVDSVENIEQFFKLRYSPIRFALSQYFCELSYFLGLSGRNLSRHLKLLLNAIWLLEKGCLCCEFIKFVFELKLLSISGYMPNLVCCKFCCSYENDVMFFCARQGFLVCADCANKNNKMAGLVELSKASLYAMRYVVYKEDRHIFKFKLDKKYLVFLSNLVENMVLLYLEKDIITLKIYKELVEGV